LITIISELAFAVFKERLVVTPDRKNLQELSGKIFRTNIFAIETRKPGKNRRKIR